jgi:hypothetical protein
MHQVAEFSTAERVVAEILDDGAAVCIGMRLPDLVLRKSRISHEQKGLDLIDPQQVNDFLVRQNGVCGQTVAAHQYDEKKRRCTDRTQAPALGNGAW